MNSFRNKLSLFFVVVFILNFSTVNVYASKDYDVSLNVETMQELSDGVIEIEEYLDNDNTSVIEELEILKNEYNKYKEELLLIKEDNVDYIESISQVEKLENLINEIDILISDYESYVKRDNNIQTMALPQPTASASVAAVIAYFNNKDYKLSAELLTHMKSNKKLNSTYIPIYKGRVRYSTTYKRIMSNKTSTVTDGKDRFISGSGNGLYQMDLYYAIHQFKYNKYKEVITISDRYDYDNTKSYEGLAGIAVDMMFKAQNSGYLTPFYTSIMFNEANPNGSL